MSYSKLRHISDIGNKSGPIKYFNPVTVECFNLVTFV